MPLPWGMATRVTDECLDLASRMEVVNVAVGLGFGDDETDRLGRASSDYVRAVAADLGGNGVAGGGRNIGGNAETGVTVFDRTCGHEGRGRDVRHFATS